MCKISDSYNYSLDYFLWFPFQLLVVAITIGSHFSTCICRLVRLSSVTLCSNIMTKRRSLSSHREHAKISRGTNQLFDPALFGCRNFFYLRLILNWPGDWLRSLVSDVFTSLSAPAQRACGRLTSQVTCTLLKWLN